MKMYVFLRKDLPSKYAAVQGGHALAEYMLKNPMQAAKWGNHTLIYLQVDNEKEMIKLEKELLEQNEIFASFREPDIGDELTAIAICSNPERFKLFRLF